MDGPLTDTSPVESPLPPSPVLDQDPGGVAEAGAESVVPPVINVTVMDPPASNGSPRHHSQDSSSSHSTVSEMSAELSSSDNSSKVTNQSATHLWRTLTFLGCFSCIVMG